MLSCDVGRRRWKVLLSFDRVWRAWEGKGRKERSGWDGPKGRTRRSQDEGVCGAAHRSGCGGTRAASAGRDGCEQAKRKHSGKKRLHATHQSTVHGPDETVPEPAATVGGREPAQSGKQGTAKWEDVDEGGDRAAPLVHSPDDDESRASRGAGIAKRDPPFQNREPSDNCEERITHGWGKRLVHQRDPGRLPRAGKQKKKEMRRPRAGHAQAGLIQETAWPRCWGSWRQDQEPLSSWPTR